MKRVLLLLLLCVVVNVPSFAFAQPSPSTGPWVDTGTDVRLRNEGVRELRVNTNFIVDVTGQLSLSAPTGIELKSYLPFPGATSEIHFRELDINGTDYIGLKAPDSVPLSITYVLPSTGPSGTQCLADNGTHQLFWTGCSGSSAAAPGSSNQVVYNASGSFGANANFTFNPATNTLSVTNLTVGSIALSAPTTVPNGGTGQVTLTQNGVLYGNGLNPVQSTAQGAADTVLTANASAPVFSGQPSLAIGVITKGQDAVEIRPYGVASGNTGEIRFLELAANGTNYAGFRAKDSITSNQIWTLPATDSSGTQCLSSDGNHILGWTACSGGAGTPAGANTQVQFNASGAFGASANFTFTVGTNTLAVTNLTLTNALAVASGGSGVQTLTANGVVYGNGTSPLQVTAQGAVNSALAANAGAPFFTQQLTLNTGVITKGQEAFRLDPFGIAAGNTGELRFLELAANGTNYVGFKASDSIAASLMWTLPTADAVGTQCLASNGSGVLSWTNCSLAIGGANTYVQFNNSGVLGGDAGFVYNASTDTATLGTLNLTNALATIYGGTGNASFTQNGVLYGNGVSNLLVTAQGGANTVLTANNGAPQFSTNITVTSITTIGQASLSLSPYGSSAGNTGEIRWYELTANGSNYVSLKAADSMAGNINFVWPATDSTGTQCLSSNGSGGLGWSACSGGTGTPGGSNGQVQYNSAGSFAGSANFTFDGTIATIAGIISDVSTFRVDNSAHTVNFGIAGTRTASLKLSGATSGTVTLTVGAAAGNYTFTLPTTAGNNGECLATNGSAVTSWTACATASNTVTFTNKRITPRVVSMADASSITPTADTADRNTQSNTQAAGNLTVNAPSGTPTDGQCLWIKLVSTNVQTFVFNAIYRGSIDLPLPTSSSGGGKADYILACYNSGATKWDILSRNFGF